MAAYRHRASWRTIIFNEHLADAGAALDNPANIVEAKLNDAYYLDELDFNRVSVQDYRELKQYLEGAEPNEAYEGVRAITGSGRMLAATPGDLEDKAWALNEAFSVAACRIAATALDPKGVIAFDFKRDTTGGATKALRFYARPGPGRPVWVGRRMEGLVRPFSFQVIAFDPFAYDQSETTDVMSSSPENITNLGSIYTKPRIEIAFTGAGSATLTLTNTTTGNAFVIDASTAANGETWVIDVGKGTLTRKSDGANRYSQRVSGFISSMFLPSGTSTWTRANVTNVGSITFFFRGAYA